MLWHRQHPHEAYTWPLPTNNSLNYLRLAWCCQIRGYLRCPPGDSLCEYCYRDLPDRINYERIYMHYISDGHTTPGYWCCNCGTSLLIQSPLSNCHLCTRLHLNLLSLYDRNNLDIDVLGDPLIIYVNGLYASFERTNPVTNEPEDILTVRVTGPSE